MNASRRSRNCSSTKVIQNAAYDCAAFGRHRRSSPKLVRVSLWETVERVMASKELINRPFRGFPEEASIVAKSTPRLLRSHFLSGARSTFVLVQDFFLFFFFHFKTEFSSISIIMNLFRWNILGCLYNLFTIIKDT